MKLKLAMDKSVRSVDKFGRMRVEMSNISKACVNPYYGREIPNSEGLGLDPDKVYQLLRDPKELAKAAETFNNLPLLDRHIPVTADAPSKEFIVGSTGTDANFNDPFLRNSLMIWCANSIAGVTTNEQRELSAAYSYDAVMTPGIFDGVAYDGIMMNIKGNHVALVEAGRAGPDVIVGDSKLLEKPEMKVGKLSAKRKAALAVALKATVGPMLAQDAQIKDLTAIAGTVDSLKTAKQKQGVITAIKAHYGDKLAQDADLEGVIEILEVLAEAEEVGEIAIDEDDGLESQLAGATPEMRAKILAMLAGTAVDEAPDDKKEPPKKDDKDKVDKPAMDAAIRAAESSTVKRMNGIFTAMQEVEPLIGKIVVAQDSAEAVYKLALDANGMDLDGVHPSAYKALVGVIKNQASAAPTRVTIAQDSAGGAAAFDAIFKNAGKMKGGV